MDDTRLRFRPPPTLETSVNLLLSTVYLLLYVGRTSSISATHTYPQSAMNPSLEYVLRLASAHANCQILRDRHLPDAEEARTISNISSIILEERAHVGVEIQRLESLRTMLTAQLEVSQAVLAPVRRLPAELLAEIFTLVAEGDASFYNIQFCHSILQTCTTWRAVALGTPRLWNHIVLYNGRVTRNTLHALDFRLSITVSVPLHLTLGGPLWRRPKLWRLLLSRATQWGSLIWRGSAYNTFPSDTPTMQLSALESVALEFTRESADVPPPMVPLDLFTCAWNVRRLTLKVHDPVIAGLKIPQLWHLTHLCLVINTEFEANPRDWELIARMLQQCHLTLESLDIGSTRPRQSADPFTDITTPFVFPHLTWLRLSRYTDWLFEHIRAPPLEHLTLVAISLWPLSSTRLAAFAQHSPSLRRLSLENVRQRYSVDCARLVDCLRTLPRIAHLSISKLSEQWLPSVDLPWLEMSISLMDALTCSAGAQVLMPELREMDLRYENAILDEKDGTLQNLHEATQKMLLSRKEGQAEDERSIVALTKFTTNIPPGL
ncbi:hypothetical protein GGF50DRAFT_131102 [Schizophyllum commune]